MSTITTDELDTLFDEGKEDVLQHFDLENARRVKPTQKRVNVDFPVWMLNSLDREAKNLGVSRQALIKFWISDRLSSPSEQTRS